MTTLSCTSHPLKISVKKFTPITRVIETAGSPWGTNRLVNWCKENFSTVTRRGLEADDSLGIDATMPGSDETILCSPDKDLRQVPGLYWDMKGDVEEITKGGRRPLAHDPGTGR